MLLLVIRDMNKIVIGNEITSDSEWIKINKNEITFLKSGDYEFEYVNDGEYNLTFIVNDDVNVLESSFDLKLKINNHYVVNKGKLNITKFYNNHSVDEVIDIDLCTSGALVGYKFANICRESENYVININHLSPKTKSDINNKSVALSNSKLNFVINSNVLKKSIKSVLNQNTRIVSMGECDAKISPNMFIDLDDVEAKHGSVIGTFKEDDIFYLMSKGISYNDTLKLMIKGYLLSNMLEYHEIRKKIIDIIDVYWR